MTNFIYLTCTVVLSLFASEGIAQAAAPANAAHAPALSAVTDMADGEVRRVDKNAKKVTLKHGPIKSLDMPPMTMVFQVRDESILSKLEVGQKIKFLAEQQQGAYVVTHVAPTPLN